MKVVIIYKMCRFFSKKWGNHISPKTLCLWTTPQIFNRRIADFLTAFQSFYHPTNSNKEKLSSYITLCYKISFWFISNSQVYQMLSFNPFFQHLCIFVYTQGFRNLKSFCLWTDSSRRFFPWDPLSLCYMKIW